MKEQIVTRIAPSPTGPLHIGTARSALFNYLFAHKHNGKFILRLEDTDKARSQDKFEEDILEGLKWLGLSHDGPYRQSERTEYYKTAAEQLIESGAAYLSKEASKDNPSVMTEVLRLRNRGDVITFTDIIRGEVSTNTTELGDFVIARSLTKPLYHLAVVVDDQEMGVTHVIRGEDLIASTSRQILIQEALGYQRPQYAHIPLILAPDRSKLSKRKGSTSLAEYREKGYLPEAVLNYLALLGWNPGTDQEFFSILELVDAFDLPNVQSGGAVFDEEKLKWFNRAYIGKLSPETFIAHIDRHLPEQTKALVEYNPDILPSLVPIISERIETLEDIASMAKKGELDYFFAPPIYEPDKLFPKDEADAAKTRSHLDSVVARLQEVPNNNFTAEKVKDAVWDYASKEGRGAVLWPMRVALSGRDSSPDPFVIATVIGKDKTLKRLQVAEALLSTYEAGT